MTPEVKEKIFEPFFTTKGVGAGHRPRPLHRLRHRQADRRVHLCQFEGRARVDLPHPLAAPRDPSRRRRAEEAERPAAPSDLTGSAKILLVEDEEAVRAFAGRALDGARLQRLRGGVRPRGARHLQRHAGEAIDLVISDVVMPGMDGPTLMRELRRRQPDLKIIFVSGYAEDAFERHLPKDEDFQFLPKPFSLKELATTVKTTLEA